MSAQSFPASTFIQGYQEAALVQGSQVKKGPLTLPQTGTGTLFTVTGGAILVTSLVGLVTTAIGATATNLSIGLAPTVGTAQTAGIGGPTAITSAVAGDVFGVPATPGVGGVALTTPGIPLSTVPVTNGYHGTVQVVITGGAMTNVSVNGVTVGTGAGTYFVPAQGTIVMTYTLAPTWAWTASNALVIGIPGSAFLAKEHVVSAGAITWTTTGSTTGAVTWYLEYVQLDNLAGEGMAGVGAVIS